MAVFVYCHAMEAKGTGFEKIEKDYEEYDGKHKPIIFSKDNQFSIVLPDLTNPEGIALEDDSIMVLKKAANPSRFDNKILAFCFFDPRTANEVAKNLGVANSTYPRSDIIGGLIKEGLLIEEKGFPARFKTNADLVKRR